MIQVEPIQNLDGFGAGQAQGEYFYSQGMNRTQFGLSPNWSAIKEVDSAALSGLALIYWFSQGTIAGSSYIFAIDKNGQVYRSPIPIISWSKLYKPYGTINGNGMIIDQTNRLLVAGDRYLSKYDGATANYATGTIAVTSASPTVVGTGTTFTSAMVGRQILIAGIFYTVHIFTDTTHIDLNATYASGTASGLAFTIYMGSTEQWKDFGSAYDITGLRPMDMFEDWVVIGNGNSVSLLNVTDDSFNNEGLLLPSGYNVACLRSGRTGILIGVNINNRGALVLWEPTALGSIAPWIWLNANIKAIVPNAEGGNYGGWYVITSRGIYSTNGYVVQPLYQQMPDDLINVGGLLKNLLPKGVELVGKYLIFLGGGNLNRQRGGIYIFNTITNTFEFCPVDNNVQFNLTVGAILYDNSSFIHLSYTTDNPAITAIDRLLNTAPASAYFVTEPKGQGGNLKTADAAKLTITQYVRDFTANVNSATFTVSLKVYNYKRPFWTQAQTNGASTAADVIKIDGTAFAAKAGDEVTMLEGVNAGQVRHIKTIANQGASNEQWTLDSVLPNNTESLITLSVTPFKLVRKYTFSSIAELRDVYFDIASKYEGKRFLLKFLFENISNTAIEINDGQFMYSDQGLITS